MTTASVEAISPSIVHDPFTDSYRIVEPRAAVCQRRTTMTAVEWQELADAIASHDEESAAPLLRLYRAESDHDATVREVTAS